MNGDHEWTREEALEKLRAINGSRKLIAEWNEYRGKNQDRLDWIPDLSDKDNPAYLHDVVLADTTHGEDEEPLCLDLGCAILAHAVLIRANLTGVNLRESILTDADLKSADLSRAHLSDVNLSGADLRDAILTETILSNANLTSASLVGANLTKAFLNNANLIEADLSNTTCTGADLMGADLTRANLIKSNLTNGYLSEANLTHSTVLYANLSDATLWTANVTSADLTGVNLTGANLKDANLSGAGLRVANLTNANVMGVIYSRRKLRGKCMGARVATCYGHAIFKRDVEDQDYVDTLKDRLESVYESAATRGSKLYAWWNLKLFRAWGWIDYGRSMWLASLFAICIAFLFGVVFFCDMKFSLGLMDYRESANSLFTPFYYSIVTYTTLGFGDVTPLSWIGEVFVVAEVIFGYLTLGLLISILANKVARRS